MPRKKRTIVEETLPDNSITTPEGETIMFGDDTPIDEVFDTFGEEPFLIKVYRITPTGSSWAFNITEKPNPAMFESLIQDRCPMGGKFVCRFYKNNRIIEPSRHIEIEPKPVSNVPVTNNTNEVVINMLQQQLATFQNMVMAFIGRPAPIAQQTPVNELVTVMTAMNAMNGNKPDSVDMLIKGMELGKGIGGAATDWKTELVSTAKDVLAPVAGAIAQHKLQQQNMPQANPSLQQIPERTNNGMAPSGLLIKTALGTLKPKIMAGMLEPGLAVDWIIANATDAMYQPFLAMALQGDINTIIGIDPEFANEPYRGWATQVITMLKEAYANNQGNSDGRTGDHTDTTSNEIISSGVVATPQAS